jgi:putative DNA methylase
MTYSVKSPKKLIEVALPLDAINEAAAREKSIRHGHPSTLHLWWARRPLAAARAVIFSQLVNDPSWKWELENPGKIAPGHLKASWAASRKRLFKIIEDLVKWENTTNEEVLEKARAEIRRSWREVCELNKDHPQAAELFNPEKLPALHDPFAGGGSIPLEAQRLGLEAYASDLNPVAVLINKAMIEIPPKFAGRKPVSLIHSHQVVKPDLGLEREWPGATGLAEDLRYYGAWMREEAQKRIGHLYPPVEITAEMAQERPDLKPLIGHKLTVIAWLWARTVKSPNPAFSHVDVPLVSTFILSSKDGKEAYVQPVVDGDCYNFRVKMGTPPSKAKDGTKLARANFGCLVSGVPINIKYIRSEACEGRMGMRLMAVVVEGPKGRIYLEPKDEIEKIACSVEPSWKSELKVTTPCHDIDRLPMYGMFTWGDAFTSRQLVALTTLSDLVTEVREKVTYDALAAGMLEDERGVESGGSGTAAYADAVSILLGLAVSRSTNSINSLVVWSQSREQSVNLFSRQAIPMSWDFPEVSPFSGAAGDFGVTTTSMARCIENVSSHRAEAFVSQAAAQTQIISTGKIISTDPPYYDNVGYADLSDFFYVWLRHTLRPILPDLLATMSVPKAEELVAATHRYGSKEKAEAFFLHGMTQAMNNIAKQAHAALPITIYYAFKQSETELNAGTSSTGWESFLEAVYRSGLQLTGTWPMRTERPTGVKVMTNSLASSVILVCRKRPANALTISRREFLREINSVLPEAVDEMTKGAGDDRSPVAPVDLSQAVIGPGMAVFSKYAAVLEADGSPMSVRTALQLINRFLAEDDFDADTQFCLHWFDQFGWDEGAYGEADVLARAKATSVGGLAESGVVHSGGGKVRLLRPNEYPVDWNPEKDMRLPIWEALHQLIRTLRQQGESGAGELLAAVKAKGEGVRQLAYRLYTLCERRGWAEDARAYNELITSWSGIESAASQASTQPRQGTLFNN